MRNGFDIRREEGKVGGKEGEMEGREVDRVMFRISSGLFPCVG